MRTDLEPVFDRENLKKIFPIVNKKVCFDEMHGTSRIVESLIDLEVDKSLSEQNKRNAWVLDNTRSLTGMYSDVLTDYTVRMDTFIV